MNRPHGNRARLGGVLLAAVTALAMLALPGIAASHDHPDQAADAGTVGSFDPETGALVIDLTAGGSVSGLVTPRTRIRCDDDRGHHHGHHRHDRRHRESGATASHDGARDEHGSRGPGSDSSGRDEEPGEDTPGHDGTPPGSSEDPGRGADHSERCTNDDLVAGATVKVAELVLIDGKAIYRFVGLEPASAA